MATVKRQYRIPRKLVDAFADLPINRSAAMSLAVMQAAKDPTKLTKVLEARARGLPSLDDALDDRDTVKVSVTMDPRVVESLDKLKNMTRLPIEHVLRLAMEAYLT